MHKVFVEYAIKPEKRGVYLQYMRRLAQAERRLEVLEGTDQPGLFVEIWSGVTPEEYAAMKRERLEGADDVCLPQPAWATWVQGGTAKLHMWHFTAIR